MSHMTLYVTARTQFEAMHSWPQAPSPEAYLRAPHRHLFTVEVRAAVAHADRAIEVNQLKRMLDEYIRVELLRDRVPTANTTPPYLGHMSCEDIAVRIGKYLRGQVDAGRLTVEVLEDGFLGGGCQFL